MVLKIYYSPSTNGMYQVGINKIIPEDSIEISDSLRWELINGQATGKTIKVGADGLPFLAVIEESLDQAASVEREWRNLELLNADYELNKVQDSDPNSVGSVAGWRSYRKELRVWPEHPQFPKKEFRPKPPTK